jgi:hypothetical protein
MLKVAYFSTYDIMLYKDIPHIEFIHRGSSPLNTIRHVHGRKHQYSILIEVELHSPTFLSNLNDTAYHNIPNFRLVPGSQGAYIDKLIHTLHYSTDRREQLTIDLGSSMSPLMKKPIVKTQFDKNFNPEGRMR